MDSAFKIPPKSPSLLTDTEKLKLVLKNLVGRQFILTGKPRTDGSNLRKIIASELLKNGLPEPALPNTYEIVPPKIKGVPRMLRELIDTYIITNGTSYNLQVWNRIPNCKTLLIKFDSGESLKCDDVRFVLAKIDIKNQKIDSIIITSSDYIEKHFGKFGKPTIKHQLLISSKARKKILLSETKILTYPDSKKLSYLVSNQYKVPGSTISCEPDPKSLFSISILYEKVAKELIGRRLDENSTKTRGQDLERIVMNLLGYSLAENADLVGGYPDIPNQLLEIKVQETQTVDLGKFTPEKEERVFPDSNLSTFDVRYLIALTNPNTGIIEGIILAPGEKLGELFTYVSDVCYKCQRSIPMNFFEKYSGQCVCNP